MKKYAIIYCVSGFIGGFECDTLENALFYVNGILSDWAREEKKSWKYDNNGVPRLTEEQIESWNTMYLNCDAWVIENENGEYTEYHISDEEYKKIGWMEWEELKDRLCLM